MKTRNILFDLDGTLINSKEGIISGIKVAFYENNLKDVFEKKKVMIESLIGPRIEVVINEILCDSNSINQDINNLVRSFRKYYDAKGYLEFDVYKNVEYILEYFLKHNINMIIVTNKPKKATNNIIAELGFQKYFSDIITSDYYDDKILSKYDMVQEIICKYELVNIETCIVGDQLSDIQAGIDSSIKTVFVNYGYGIFNNSVATLKVDDIIELIKLIQGKEDDK